MRKKLVLTIAVMLIAVIGAVSLAGCADGEPIPTDRKFDETGWTVAFEDDFDGDKLDTAKWRINTMPSDDPNNNGVRRAGFYTDDEETVFVKDGKLTIRTEYKQGEYGEGWYTSWVDTKTGVEGAPQEFEGFNTTYGYFEVTCIAPPAVGIWSAFWLMPTEPGKGMSANDVLGTGADGVEIDVMESPHMYESGDKCKNTHVVHGDGYSGNLKSDKSPTYHVPDMYSKMNTYAVEWNEEEYIFYINGYETWRTKHSYTDKDGNVKQLGVSRVNEHIILSVEVAGTRNADGSFRYGEVMENGKWVKSWNGNPADNDKNKQYDFVIDSVRVLKKG